MKKFRFHVVGLPHTQTNMQHSACAFTMKILHFCQMMTSLGHEVIHYGAEGSEVDCEHVQIMSKDEQEYYFGPYTPEKLYEVDWSGKAPYWNLINTRAATEINKRKQPRDFVCIIMGTLNRPLAHLVGNDVMIVEYGIGYNGTFAKYRVFESYAHMHKIWGAEGGFDPNGKFYDAVIPNYLNPDDYPFQKEKGDYYLYLGRLIKRKGIHIAVETCKKLGVKLKIAGQGCNRVEGNKIYCSDGETYEGDNLEYVGFATGDKRAKLYQNAKGVFVPTTYIEPFGAVAIEAQMAGTPPITTDFGAFCVPTEAEILTQRGWLTYDNIMLGIDETLGFDKILGKTRWTKITAVNHFRQQLTTQYRNRNWRIRVTDGHKWIMNKYGGEYTLKAFEDAGDADKAHLAAVACDGDLQISPQEAGIIAWLLTDGSVNTRVKYGKEKSYNPESDDPNTIVRARIWQSKPKGILAIQEILCGTYNKKSKRKGNPKHLPRMMFTIKRDFVRELFKKSEIKSRGLEGFVLNLPQISREAFLKACIDAEGWKAKKGSTFLISQNTGSMLNAMVLCAYLCGKRPTLSNHSRTGKGSGVCAGRYYEPKNMVLALCNPLIRPRRLHKETEQIEDVWCPSTELGTWTMRFEKHIVLTGNTETVDHGKTGFRCRTLDQFVWAAKSVHTLDPQYIHDSAVARYAMDNVKWRYETYFRQLQDLWNDGWPTTHSVPDEQWLRGYYE